MSRMRVGLMGLALLVAMMLVVGCAQSADADKTKKDSTSASETADNKKDDSKSETTAPQGTDSKNPIVTMEMQTGEKIEIELYPEIAPNTVANFVNLVSNGFYDGLIFHRIMAGFMIQGGDPDGTGMGGPGYAIKGEFSANGFPNDLVHEQGVISMARTESMDTAGSQFFIMHDAVPYLDGMYAAFGKVISGLEHVVTLGNVATDSGDRPVKDQVIKSMTVDTKGVDYGEPVKVGQ